MRTVALIGADRSLPGAGAGITAAGVVAAGAVAVAVACPPVLGAGGIPDHG